MQLRKWHRSVLCLMCLLSLFGYIFIYQSMPREKQSVWNYFKVSGIFERFGIRNQRCVVNTSNCNAFTCPEFRNLISDWQNASSDGSVYVYSAFYDKNKITILGAAIETNVPLFCQIWARTDGVITSMSMVKAVIRYLPDHHGQRYRPSYFLCKTSGISTPFAVSLVSADPCSSPLHVLPVLSRPGSSYKDMRRNFTVCVAPLHLEKPDTNALVEWIEFNRILGAEYFVFYNYLINSRESRVLQYYSHRGLAEVHPWTLGIREKIWYFGQTAAINDCIFRHKNSTDFIAVFDLDEFIIPRWGDDRTWNEMLQRLPRASSYIFRTVFFPRQIQMKGHESGRTNLTSKDYNLITMTKTNRTPKIWPAKLRSKAMHNPRNVDVAGIHFAFSLTRGKNIVVDTSIGLVHHYRRWNFNTTETDTRALWYKADLIDRVNRTWKNINLYEHGNV